MDPENVSHARFRRKRGGIFIGVGAGFLFLAYLIFFKSSQFTLRLTDHSVTYHRTDYPITFAVAAAAAVVIGAYHLIQGIRLIVSTDH